MPPSLNNRLLRYATVVLLLLATCIFGLFLIVRAHVQSRIVTADTLAPEDWAIVFGAKVWGKEPSPMLEDRLSTALQLLQQGKISQLFLSGGPSEDGLHEADFMAEWLLLRGVDQSILTRDYDGLDTVTSLKNAHNKHHIRRALLITQGFHLPRALLYASLEGIDALGVLADQREYQDELYAQFRELFAFIPLSLRSTRLLIPYVKIALSWFNFSSDKTEAIAEGRKKIQQRFQSQGVSYPPKFVRLLYTKTQKTLSLYVGAELTSLHHLHSYLVLAASGGFGPKLREGDKQVPEGIYPVTFLNEASRYHLSLRLGYPNAFDRKMAEADGRMQLGGDIMIHGNAVSIGCIAIGDEAIEEVFALARDSQLGLWKVLIAPRPKEELFKVSPVRVESIPFWYPELLTQLEDELQLLPQ